MDHSGHHINMMLLTTSFFVIALNSVFALKIEADVRMLAPNGLVQDAGPCVTLQSRAFEHWDSGLFSNCTFEYMHYHNKTDLEVVFEIEVDISKLPNEYQHNVSYDFQMWYVNRLLNGEEERCLTATGEGQDKDSFVIRGFIADYVPREKFILVMPFVEDMCPKIINQTFIKDQITILDCALLEISVKPVDGHVLAKYSLTTLEMQENFEPFQHNDIHIFFLQELNGLTGACIFNGYWAKFDFVEAPYNDYDNFFMDHDGSKEEEDEEEVIINIEDRRRK